MAHVLYKVIFTALVKFLEVHFDAVLFALLGSRYAGIYQHYF